MFTPTPYAKDPSERCEEIFQQAAALVEGETHLLANLANLAALLYTALPDVNWAGFYLLHEGELLLGPFGGNPACIRIAPGRGVCGTALLAKEPLRVDDVHAFPGHIACDSLSRSELVVPFFLEGTIAGVIDLDSPLPARFTQAEQDLVERIAQLLAKTCPRQASYTL